ncbi:MAG TPA: hypothetical protein VFL13_10805 [Candidatus Baltobacteraceae bacterium]|nr:hypothetical protein [Candidatus Baltobacteraceae bacterium]
MNVTDLPKPATHSLYDEALTRYAELVKTRAISVYRVGNVRYPGLSDVDLLVVTDRHAIDNRYFFSALARLPQRFHGIFLHEPFVLPVWSLRVMRHTTHYAPALLAGRDVLHGFPPSDELDERWCRMLESYCSYAQFRKTATDAKTLKGRQTVAVASALRYLLNDAAYTLETGDAEKYGARIDSLRERFFSYADPADGVLESWNLFGAALDQFEKALFARLPECADGDPIGVARDLLRGERECDAFDREYAFRRAREIDGYNQELASMHLPFGHLFFIAAHPPAVYAQEPAVPVLGEVVRNFYRVRRRLSEYAGA